MQTCRTSGDMLWWANACFQTCFPSLPILLTSWFCCMQLSCCSLLGDEQLNPIIKVDFSVVSLYSLLWQLINSLQKTSLCATMLAFKFKSGMQSCLISPSHSHILHLGLYHGVVLDLTNSDEVVASAIMLNLHFWCSAKLTVWKITGLWQHEDNRKNGKDTKWIGSSGGHYRKGEQVLQETLNLRERWRKVQLVI